jgi:hypothetical protein
MKEQLRWFGFVAVFSAVTAATLGCYTYWSLKRTKEEVSRGTRRTQEILQSDEIIALGRPDASLSEKLGQKHAVAFLGRKSTYLLYQGGEELERISELSLNGRRLDIGGSDLYMKGKQVWGNLHLDYALGGAVSAEERKELERGEFDAVEYISYEEKRIRYTKTIHVEGVVFPPVQFTDSQLSQLTIPRRIDLRDPHITVSGRIKPIIGGIMALPVYILLDAALAPVSVPLGAMFILSEMK